MFKATCNVFKDGVATYGHSASVKILHTEVVGTATIPVSLHVTIKSGKSQRVSFVIQSACNGLCTLPNGSVNLEAISKVLDSAGSVQLGVGCIEANNFADMGATAAHMMALAGLKGPASLFTPQKLSLSQSGPSIAVLVAIVIAAIIILTLLIMLIVYLSRKKSPNSESAAPKRSKARARHGHVM